MPASTFAVVYGTQSQACRRVIVADSDAEVQAVKNRLQPGESVLFLNHADHPVDKRIRACAPAIAAAIGATNSIFPMRSVIVQGGVVQVALMADPAIDTVKHAGASLVQHDTANVGDIWTGQVFRRSNTFVDANGNSKATGTNFPDVNGEKLVFPSAGSFT